jgi:hypothetical protein
MRRELDEMAQRLDDEISGLAGEMRAARDELHRYRAIEEAVAVERDLDTWLN